MTSMQCDGLQHDKQRPVRRLGILQLVCIQDDHSATVGQGSSVMCPKLACRRPTARELDRKSTSLGPCPRSQIWSHSRAFSGVRHVQLSPRRAGRGRWWTWLDAQPQTWKACWRERLASSNLASSATPTREDGSDLDTFCALERLDEPWDKGIGRPKSLTFREAIIITCGYIRQNIIQEVWAEIFDTSQPVISAIITKFTPLIEAPPRRTATAEEAEAVAREQTVLVDGFLHHLVLRDTPELWSGKHRQRF